MKRLCGGLVFALILGGRLMADPAVPKLTEVQKLTLTNLILMRDNAQLRLDAFVKELTVAGYDLTTAGDYVKTPEAVTP